MTKLQKSSQPTTIYPYQNLSLEELTNKSLYKGNVGYHPVYPLWNSIKQRCYNKNSKDYIGCGGKGVQLCKEWHCLFAFSGWVLGKGWEKGLQLARIRKDGDFCPENCHVTIRNLGNAKGNLNAKFRHGLSKSRLYRVWAGIKQRCRGVNNPAYKDYGGRGIDMCNDWYDDFVKFNNWALENGYNDNLFIDRINNDKSYTPCNCRFVTMSINNSNQRKQKNNTSGYKGVIIKKKENRIQAMITVNKKRIYLGTFKSPKDAALAYDEYIDKHQLINYIKNFK